MKGFSEGERIGIKGIITNIRTVGNEKEYLVEDGNATFSFRSKEIFSIGEAIVLNGILKNLKDFAVAQESITTLTGNEAEAVCREVERNLSEKIILRRDLLSENPASFVLLKKMELIAKKLLVARKLNRFFLLRFHGDADGIGGALALREVIRFRAFQQNGAVYSPREAVNDMAILHYENRPILILLDFGTNSESIDGLRLIKAAGVETIAIDHHPLDSRIEQFADALLNPWSADGLVDPSYYPGGYLASEIARLCGAENIDHYAKIACAGDKSDLLQPNEEERKAALVLDYLAVHASFGNNLDFYRDVLRKKELFDSLWQQASDKIKEAVENVLPRVKKTEKNGIVIYTAQLDGILTKGEFPNKSKLTTAIFENFSTNLPMITIGYGDGVVIGRCNSAFVQSRRGLSDIIKRISSDMKNFVIAGGGHARAAAIRVEKGYEKFVVEQLIEAF